VPDATRTDRPLVAILAGGGSTRMGRDKALVTVAGRTMLARAIDGARAAGLDVVVVGRELAEIDSADEGVRWLRDERPGAGPLAALATPLRTFGREVLLIACDMPRLDDTAIAWLAAQPMAEGAAAMMVRNDETIEPLFARYRPACLGAVERALASGRGSLRSIEAYVDVDVVDAPDWLRPLLLNINTPADLERLGR
jgi:molybdopterin-guanine dinucleotide biosynthesis protein A